MILLQGHSLSARMIFAPESMPMTLVENGVSTASFTVGPAAPEIKIDDWLLDDQEPGAGTVWRVKGVDEDRCTRTRTVQLEHVLATLKDALLFGELTTKALGGGTTVEAEKALRAVLSRQSVWTLGDFEFSRALPYAFNNQTAYQALETICSTLDGWRWEYDLSALPFKLHVRKKSDALGCELRGSRNLSSVRYSVDRSGMYTRFYPVGARNLHIDGDYVSRNEALYGVVCHTETDQSITKKELLKAWAEDQLNRHAEPLVTVSLTALDLSAATGEPLDRIRLGFICRVPLPAYGTVITERVTKLAWPDKIREPEKVNVTLANQPVDVANLIKQLSSSGSRNSGGGAKAAEEDHAWIEDTSDHVALVAEAIIGKDGDGVDWSRVSEIVVDGEGIHQRVVKTEGELVVAQSRIDLNENRILLETTRAETAEKDLNRTLSAKITVEANRITQEVTDRRNGDDILSGRITVEANRITQEVTNREQADAELSGRITVEAGRITQEVTDRRNGDDALSGRITVEANRITQEVTDRTNADTTLSGKITVEANRITQEVTDRQSGDDALSGRITVEANRITQEATDRQSGDDALSGRITVEAGRITQEVTDRQSGDDALSGRITVEAGRITQEVTDRTNADAALSSRITQTSDAISAEVNRAISYDNYLTGWVTVNYNKVSMVVSETAEGGYVVNSASIVAGINAQDGSYVKIQASKINLDGYVTASELNATNANIDNLTSGKTTASKLVAGTISCSTLVLATHQLRYFDVTDTGGYTRHVVGYA